MPTKKANWKLLDKLSSRAGKIAGLISAIVAIAGAITGLMSWLTTQMTYGISQQISEFRTEVKSNDEKQNQQITRLELMNLIQNDPTNVAGIEKLARYYFQELNGNQYMTGVFSRWCQEYGGDPSIIVGGK